MEHDSKVEVIEKHYHNSDKNDKGPGGVAIAGLTTGTVGAAGVLGLSVLELVKAFAGRISNGGGSNPAAMIASIASAVAPAIAAMSGPRYAPSCTIDCGEASILRSRIATLEAEKYSDNAAKSESERLLVNYLKPYGQEIAANQVVIAKLQAEIDCGKKTSELEKKNLELQIQLAKQEAECCCKANATAIQAVATMLGSITKTVVPSTAVCTPPTTTAGA
jgi:hypothetical protein